MATPQNALEVRESRRFRTRIHIDLAPDVPATAEDFEVHMDLIVPGDTTSIGNMVERLARGGLQGLMQRGQEPDPIAQLERLLRLQAAGGLVNPREIGPNQGVGPNPPNQVRFSPNADGTLRCSVCHRDVAEADVAAHARTHGAPAVHQEIAMRLRNQEPPVPEPPGGLPDDGGGGVPPRPPEATPGEGIAVAGTVEDAANGVVRIDGAVGYDAVPGPPGIVRCRGCQQPVIEADWPQHVEGHVRRAPV